MSTNDRADRKRAALADQKIRRGNGGETHQTAEEGTTSSPRNTACRLPMIRIH